MAKKERVSNPLVSQKIQRYQPFITAVLLLVIFVFAVFLRLEDFADWRKNPQFFKYQSEYQMANFDSYYYLQFAKDLENNNYDEVDEKRRVPNGTKRPKIPPLLPLMAFGISKISNIPIATVAIFIPVFLSSLLLFVVFLLGRKFGLNSLASLVAALFSVISITYVVRTRIGVFDSDSLNVIFALLNGYLLLRSATEKKNYHWFLLLAFINMLLYFIWWNTASSVVVLSAFVPISVAILFFYRGKFAPIRYYLLALMGLVIGYFFFGQIWDYIKLALNQTSSIFSVTDIAELIPVSIGEFIQKTSNSVIIFIIAWLGNIYLLIRQKTKVLFITIPVMLALLPFLSGSRFMIFSAPILALGVGFFVQLLFDFKNKIHISIAYLASVLIVVLGIYSTYHTITYKLAKPTALDNMFLLNALKAKTPTDANIWTNWDLGNQIHYYLDQGTFADGEFSDGELFYYLHFPLAAENLALSANFIRFYAQKGVSGIHKLYKIFGSEVAAFNFLKAILPLRPKEAKAELARGLASKQFPATNDLATPQQWLDFLYPAQTRAVYVLLHQKMLQTSSWFKQGSMDLKSGQTKGLPLFLEFANLSEKWGEIKNKDIVINKKTGYATHRSGGKHFFAHIFTYSGNELDSVHYPQSNNAVDNLGYNSAKRFVFEWNKNIGYGAVMSQQVANTTFNKLFMRQYKSNYFQPILLKTPAYQIWQVFADEQ